MHNSWDADSAARCSSELALRAYSSRLLGNDPSLVLLGGGNTSVKLPGRNGEDLLYVKGTGADLANVLERDFTPLRLKPVRDMLRHDHMAYAEMMAGLAAHVTVPTAPKPSIETLLHAALSAKYVEHTHADSILAITNTENGMALAEKIFSDIALVVPYRHSGFSLAKLCAEAWLAHASPATIGIILIHHGAVACGNTAKESYENMLRLVARAETYLDAKRVVSLPEARLAALDETGARDMAGLRRDISRAAGYPLLLTRCDDPVATAFAQNHDAGKLSAHSPATPQHAVFARRLPMTGRDVRQYAHYYFAYLQQSPEASRRLDAAPRIVLDPVLGMLAAGITPWHMDAAATSYRHTIDTLLRANAHDTYAGLPPRDILEAELEYGGVERRIATSRASAVALAGTVTLLAPSLGPILKPLAATILAGSGAVVVFGNASHGHADIQGFLALGDDDPIPYARSFIEAIGRFGGIDTLICTPDDAQLLTLAMPWLRLSPLMPRVVIVVPGHFSRLEQLGLPGEFLQPGLARSVVNATAFASTLSSAKAIAQAAAVQPVYSFPEFD